MTTKHYAPFELNCHGCGEPWPCEVERLTRERDDARRWAVRLEQLMFAERDAAYSLLLKTMSGQPLFSGKPTEETDQKS